MNKREKETLGLHIRSEDKALKELRTAYNRARADVKKQISALNARQDMQNLQSIVYQKRYQNALLKQIEGVLNDLKTEQHKTFNDFFQGSYVNGYIGSMYNLQGQGIPMTVPIDPKKMKRAIETDSKLSKSYYEKRQIPENLERMKRSIRMECTRGIASGKTWVEVAYQVAEGMNSPISRAMNDAMRIVRTEGHRINQQGFVDAGDVAKSKGADIVKQWDATLDSRTRPWHQEADGQIREWDDDFIVHGEKMKAPSLGGSASNVINCRCQLLQRARWALDEEELKTLQDRAKFYGLDKTKDFEDYKQKFLNLPSEKEQKVIDFLTSKNFDPRTTTTKLKAVMKEEDYEEFMKLVESDPFMSNLFGKADGIKKVEFKKGRGCCWGRSGLEFGYPDDEYIKNGMSKFQTLAHEYGHYFDTLTYDKQTSLTFDEMLGLRKAINDKRTGYIVASSSDQFLSAMRKDAEEIYKNKHDIALFCSKNHHTTVTIQDALDGFGYGRIWWGHGDRYYNRFYTNNVNGKWSKDYKKEVKEFYKQRGFDVSNQTKVKNRTRDYETASELWANMTSAVSCGGDELTNVKKYFPNTYKTYLDIVKELVK